MIEMDNDGGDSFSDNVIQEYDIFALEKFYNRIEKEISDF